MIRSQRCKTRATAFPVSDAQVHPPAAVTNIQGMPYQSSRVRLKKQAVVRIGTWNVGTMTGRGRELVDVMERRKIGIICVQEIRWKGNCARDLGSGYKFVSAEEPSRNGGGVILNGEFASKVIRVERKSDRQITVNIVCGGGGGEFGILYRHMHHKPEDLRKRRTTGELERAIERIPPEESVIIGGDLNAHLGRTEPEYAGVHGQGGYGETDKEGERLLETMQAYDLYAMNTKFKKREEQLITYRSGGNATQIDYIQIRGQEGKKLKDVKVLPYEAATKQHRHVVADIERRKRE